MSNFELGKQVEGTTLVPIVKLKDGYGCTCVKCGKGNIYNGFNEGGISMVYTKSNLVNKKQLCRYCKFISKANSQKQVELKQGSSIETIDTLLIREGRLNSGDLTAARAGDYYIATQPTLDDVDVFMQDLKKKVGELVIFGYIGKIKSISQYGVSYKKPTSTVLVCPYCGYKIVVDCINFRLLCKGNYNCVNNCSSRLDAVNETKRVKIASENKAKRIAEQQKLSSEGISLLSDSVLQRFKKSNKYRDLTDKIFKRYPNHEIVDIELTKEPSGKKSYDTIIVCKNCGSIMSIGSSERVARKCQCEDKPYIKGKLNQNYVNTVHNGLIITEQLDDFKCNIKCFHCGNEQKEVPLYDVLNDKFCCSCYEYEDLCESCGAPVKFSVRDILNGKKCTCSKCGSPADLDNLVHSIKLENTKFTFSRLHNGSAKGMRPISATFLKDNEALYTGTNGVHYYRCFCMEHNKDLILTADESKDYNHEKCSGLRQMSIKKLTQDDFKNIRV